MQAFTLLLLALLLALIPISTCAGAEVKVLSDAEIELATNLQSTLSGRINGTGQPFPATGMSEELRHFATQALLARQGTYLELQSDQVGNVEVAKWSDAQQERYHAVLLKELLAWTVPPADEAKNPSTDALTTFITMWLDAFCIPQARLTDMWTLGQYLLHLPKLHKLVRASTLATTDAAVSRLVNLGDAEDLRLLVVATPYNQAVLQSSTMYPQFHDAGDLWFSQLLQLVQSGSMGSPLFYTNLRGFVADLLALDPMQSHPRLLANDKLQFSQFARPSWWQLYDLFFVTSYIDSDGAGAEAAIKARVNVQSQSVPLRDPLPSDLATVAAHPKSEGIEETLSPRAPHDGKKARVLMISPLWKNGHSVHRNFKDAVTALQGAFDVSLLAFETSFLPRSFVDTEGFTSVAVVPGTFNNDFAEALIGAIKNAMYDIVFFPEVGMSENDIMLANTRLAPAMVTTYGHSASTHGSLIDWWVGGEEAELPLDQRPQDSYSERLLLVPGMGVTFRPRSTEPLHFDKPKRHGDIEVIVGAPWAVHKMNAEHVQRLSDILRTASAHLNPEGDHKQRIELRFLIGARGPYFSNQAALADVTAALGTRTLQGVRVSFVPLQAYEGYAKMVAESDIVLDSFPYGGCNSVHDALLGGTIVLTLEGAVWRNRIAAAMLRRIGLPELVTTSAGDFVDRAIQLIIHPDLRQQLQAKLIATDLESTLGTATGEAAYFVPAFELVHLHARQAYADRPRPEPPRPAATLNDTQLASFQRKRQHDAWLVYVQQVKARQAATGHSERTHLGGGSVGSPFHGASTFAASSEFHRIRPYLNLLSTGAGSQDIAPTPPRGGSLVLLRDHLKKKVEDKG